MTSIKPSTCGYDFSPGDDPEVNGRCVSLLMPEFPPPPFLNPSQSNHSPIIPSSIRRKSDTEIENRRSRSLVTSVGDKLASSTLREVTAQMSEPTGTPLFLSRSKGQNGSGDSSDTDNDPGLCQTIQQRSLSSQKKVEHFFLYSFPCMRDQEDYINDGSAFLLQLFEFLSLFSCVGRSKERRREGHYSMHNLFHLANSHLLDCL